MIKINSYLKLLYINLIAMTIHLSTQMASAQLINQTKRIATAEFSCNLNDEKHSSVLELIKFDTKHVTKYEADSGEEFVKFIKVGSVLKGPCIGSDFYKVVIEERSACGKSGGSPDHIFADDNIYEASEKFVFPDCHYAYHAIGMKDKIVLIGKYPYLSKEIRKIIQTKAKINHVIIDKSYDWLKLLIPSLTVKIDTDVFQVKSPQYHQIFDENSFKKEVETIRKLKLLVTLPGPTKLYQDGRQIIMETPDRLFTNAIDLGLYVNPPSDYTYITYWNSFAEKNKLTDKILIQNSSDKNLIIDQKSEFIKKSYDIYLNKINAIDWSQHTYLKPTSPKNFEEFLDSKPFLVIVDPFKEKQIFKKALLTLPQMAEPLVYLYSKKPIQVKIKFDPSIELTRTNPDYNGEWSVQIIPPNQIQDINTKKTFQSLFWEGRTFFTPPWTEGWVISQSELTTFFDSKLNELGLNKLEALEFKKYWIPRMHSSPFFKIRFFNNQFLSHYAPLTIEPKPDVIIRVHMDFHPIDQYEELRVPNKQSIPKRNGFTFVEWSGFKYQYQD